jgi:hypothetical protein
MKCLGLGQQQVFFLKGEFLQFGELFWQKNEKKCHFGNRIEFFKKTIYDFFHHISKFKKIKLATSRPRHFLGCNL